MILFFGSRYFQLACRLALAAVFLYAAFYKIRDPQAFAESIAAYRVLPDFLVNPAALVLPWIEAFAGLSLVFGFLRRGAVWLLTAMLLFFIVLTAYSGLRGLQIDCGCFGPGGRPEPPLLVIGRDLLFLVPALFILLFDRSRPALARKD